MLEARRRVSSGSGPSWIFAHIQLAGKGRRGRMWVDPTGNFACTCVFFPDRTIDRYALSSFTAALSVYDCLSDFTEGSAQVSIKWPNDILLNQKIENSVSDILEKGSNIEKVIHETSTGLKLIPGGSGVLELLNLDSQKRWEIIRSLDALKNDLDIFYQCLIKSLKNITSWHTAVSYTHLTLPTKA